MSLADIIAAIDARFVSGNAIPVERAPIKAAEWTLLREAAAALSAGAEPACQTCNGVGMIGGTSGQTPENFQQDSEPCPDCTRPQPATPASGWMPIESAPRESRVILYCDARGNRWTQTADCRIPVCGYLPILWQELPAPPASTETDKQTATGDQP